MSARSALKAPPFVGGALVCACAFVGIYLFFVRSYMGQLVDERAFAGASAWKSDLVDVSQAFLDALPYISVGIAAILALMLIIVRRNWLVFLVAIAAAVAANGSTQLLKYAILARPERGVADGLANSLPSGHTTVAASAALVVYLLAAPRFRPLAAVIGSLYAFVAGAGTLVNQWHRPSDVIAALLVVAFWGCAAGFVLATSHVATVAPASSRLLAMRWIAITLALVAAVGLAVTYFSTLAGAEHLLVAFIGALSAIAAVAFALTAVGHRLFRTLA